MGHLRQEELKPVLKAEPQTPENLFAQEQDAWERGWERFRKSNRHTLQTLEAKFQRYCAQGKLDFTNFKGLYDWVQENALRMVEAQRILFEESGEETGEERYDQLADELERSGVRNFLARFEKARVGEIVDENEMRETIKRTVELVITE